MDAEKKKESEPKMFLNDNLENIFVCSHSKLFSRLSKKILMNIKFYFLYE